MKQYKVPIGTRVTVYLNDDTVWSLVPTVREIVLNVHNVGERKLAMEEIKAVNKNGLVSVSYRYVYQHPNYGQVSHWEVDLGDLIGV